MPILSTDVQYRHSGGAANSNDEASLGGAKSANAISGTMLDDVSGAESSAGDTNYRCIYVHNAHGSLSMVSAVIFLGSQALGAGHAVALGVGTAAINGTEQTVANEATAPSGVTFTTPTTLGAALALGTIPPGQHKAVWIRRIVTAASAASSNSYALRVNCETGP